MESKQAVLFKMKQEVGSGTGSLVFNSGPTITDATLITPVLAAGTVAAPGVYLAADTDTGLYLIGANNLGVAANGAKVLDIGTTGLGVTGLVSATTSIKSSGPTSGVGYATGAGGTVTQITNRSTGVTVNKVCGTIQTDTTSLAAGASAEFTVTNSAVAIGDVVVVSQQSGSSNVAGVAGTTHVHVVTVAAGSFIISVDNNSSTTAETGAIIINFAVIKAVAA